jgi:hypothetical protein
MNVTLPNGKVIQGVPEGTPKDVIAQKAISAGLASESDFPSLYPTQDVSTSPQPEQVQDGGIMSSIQNLIFGDDRNTEKIKSMGEIIEAPEIGLLKRRDSDLPYDFELSLPGLKSAFGMISSSDPKEQMKIIKENYPEATFTPDEKGNVVVGLKSGEYTLNTPGLSQSDLNRFVFDLAAFTPAGRALSIPGAIAKSALTQTAIEGGQSLSGGDFDAREVATAGALGGAFKGTEELIGAGYRATKGQLPTAERELIEAGEEAGVPLMTTDVIEPRTFAGKMARSTGEKIPLAGTGQVRAGQQELRERAVTEFAEKYQTPSYADIVTSIRQKSKGIKQSAGKILGDTSSKLDEVGNIPVDKARDAVDSALEQLNKPNVRVDPQAIDELTELKGLLDQPQTFSSLKENRTVFRDVLESFGKGERSQLPTRSKSLIQRAISGMSDDLDSFAKTNLSPKEYSSWKKANAVYADEATKLKKTRIKNILDKGDVTPENVSTMLFSQKPSEVRSLYNSLGTEGKKNARAALIYRAVDNASKRAGGLSPNAFSSELNKISKNTDIFFRGKDRKQLEGFKRLMEATRRAQDAAVETPTGQQLIGAGAGFAAFTDLGATLGLGGTAGGLSRLYESAPVRNALLRLGSVEKGSDAYLKALFEAQSALSSGAQAIREQQEE